VLAQIVNCVEECLLLSMQLFQRYGIKSDVCHFVVVTARKIYAESGVFIV
jgi:hypothetical protein